jgi:small nuclear ribonucleoprotein (snRNP)-like protein
MGRANRVEVASARVTRVIGIAERPLSGSRQELQSSISHNMSQTNPSSFKEKLVGKTVIVKVSLFSRSFSGTITATDETGFCFASDAMVAALREMTGGAMAELDAPAVFLPFTILEYLILSQQKAAAASA